MKNMKKGVVAQLIYMLVLISIAVVVGLFFMTVVEKNKKETSEITYAEITFDATLTGTNTVAILASKNPADVLGSGDLEIYCNGIKVHNVSVTDFYPHGSGYRYEFDNGNCTSDKQLKIKYGNQTYLVKTLK